jgi:hypothetical protein
MSDFALKNKTGDFYEILVNRHFTIWIRSPKIEIHVSENEFKSPENSIYSRYFLYKLCLAVAQTVSRWLPIVAALVCVRSTCGVFGGQSDTGAGFLRALRSPLPIIPPISPSSSSPPGAGTIGLLVAAKPSGPNWTPLPPPTIPIKNLFKCDHWIFAW